MAKEIDSSTSMAALFGTRLRRLRLKVGLTQAALGRLANTHSTRINQLERATGAKPTLALARALDEAVDADELLVELWPYVYREGFPNWSRAFMERSELAVAIRDYSVAQVPGLLQTEDYARALLRTGRTLRSPEHLEERVAFRLERQAMLDRPDGPQLWAILDEAVLMRPVGGPVVMRAQLARLLEAAEHPRITLQVLPFSSGEHEVMGGQLTILTFADGSEAAYSEGGDNGRLTEEPEEVKSFAAAYEQARAKALPPNMSVDRIRSAWKAITVLHVSRPDLNAAVWRKPSYSGKEGDNCVEVADGCPGIVPVRDSKNPQGPALLIPDRAWTTFISSLKN